MSDKGNSEDALASELFNVIIKILNGVSDGIEETKDLLEDFIPRYREQMQKISLLINKGSPSQIGDFSDFDETLTRSLIDKIKNLNFIEERMAILTEGATGIQGLLQTLSKMPRDVIKMEDLQEILEEPIKLAQELNLKFAGEADSAKYQDKINKLAAKIMKMSSEKIRKEKEKIADSELVAEMEKYADLLERKGGNLIDTQTKLVIKQKKEPKIISEEKKTSELSIQLLQVAIGDLYSVMKMLDITKGIVTGRTRKREEGTFELFIDFCNEQMQKIPELSGLSEKEMQELRSYYQSLIELSKGSIQNLDHIEERMSTFTIANFRENNMTLNTIVEAAKEVVEEEKGEAMEQGSTLGGLSVNEGDVRVILEGILRDRFTRLEHKVDDSTVKVIADAETVAKDMALLEEAEKEARIIEVRQDKNDR